MKYQKYKNCINIITDRNSWIIPHIHRFKKSNKDKFDIKIYYNHTNLRKSDINFILSYSKIINTKVLNNFKFNIVIHESKLPLGKGFAPIAWQILEGKNIIYFTAFNANKKIDSGDILLVDKIKLKGNELYSEWRQLQGIKTFEICKKIILNINKLELKKQKGKQTFYKKRNSSDSKLNINKSIKNQFNLLRVVDNEKFPAFFVYKGIKYGIKINKI